MFGPPGMQGFQPPDGANPISQGRPAEVDALAGEDLSLGPLCGCNSLQYP